MRSVPTGVRASVCSAVVAMNAVTVLRPRFYEQVLTRLHRQIIGQGYLVKRQDELRSQHGFQLVTFYSNHELRGDCQVSLHHSLILIAPHSE